MKRGDITTGPQPVVGVDYRILLELRCVDSWLEAEIPKMLLESVFPEVVRHLVRPRIGARGWLSKHWEFSVVAFCLGFPNIRGVLTEALSDLGVRQACFDSPSELRDWVRLSPEVARVYTVDRSLVTTDGVVRFFEGWHEKV